MRTLLVAGLLLAAVLSVAPTASATPYACEPTPHGMSCTGDLVVCTTHSGAESNGVSYVGFNCGVASCAFSFYQGRLKEHSCPAAAGDPREHVPEVRPFPVECINGIGSSWCSVDAVVCQFRQTQYHLEDRSETELRCLGVVECTWDSGASAMRVGSDPFCPVPL